MKRKLLVWIMSISIAGSLFSPIQIYANTPDESEIVADTGLADELESLGDESVYVTDELGTQTDALEETMEPKIEDSEEVPPDPYEGMYPKTYKGLSTPDRTISDYRTWDCIWYGTYPQTEIFKYKNDYKYANGELYDETLSVQEGIINMVLYNTLEKAAWDNKNDTVIDGVKYHRITKDDYHPDKYNGMEPSRKWKDTITYRYFRYEPIKWRVADISEEEGNAVLLSEYKLDIQPYNLTDDAVTWKDSYIRSWLNTEFYNTAFSSEQQASIVQVRLLTDSVVSEDKVFLAEEKTLINQGFSNIHDGHEAGHASQLAYTYTEASCYVKAKWGISGGWIFRTGSAVGYYNKDNAYSGIRPQIQINLDTASYQYAGKIKMGYKYSNRQGYYKIVDEKNAEFIVKGVQSQPGQENSTDITWQTCESAEGYLIYGYHGSPKTGAKYEYIGMTTGNTSGTAKYTDTKASKDYNFYFVYPYIKDRNGTMTVGKCCKYTYAKGGTENKLPAVTGIKTISQDDSVKLTWSKTEGAEGYLIYGFHGSPRPSHGKPNGNPYEYFGMTETTEFVDKNAPKNDFSYYFVFAYYTNSEGKKVVGLTAPYVYGYVRPVK